MKAMRFMKGKYSIPGLPAMYAEENEAETLVITLRDDVQDVRVKLYYGVDRKNWILSQEASAWKIMEKHRFSLRESCPSVWISHTETGTG